MKSDRPVTTKNGYYLLLAILSFLFLAPVEAHPSSTPDITVTPSTIGQGEVGIIRIGGERGNSPKAIWMGKDIALINDKRNGAWVGFIGADLTTQPGRYELEISLKDNDTPQSLPISVSSKEYGVRRLTLPQEMVELDPETLERVKEESLIVKEIFARPAGDPLWMGGWIKPVAGRVISPFGPKSIINEMERSPHSGVDLEAEEGTPVMAIARGKVALVANHFFSGLSVIVDHGGGIQSMYFHLSKALVETGDLAEKGTAVGLAGSSGRATGAHLHFGVRLNGSRVDPLNLIEMGRKLERP
jgi:murein DD-endopeptidase MepM/ murein hydrolase activator NlpD